MYRRLWCAGYRNIRRTPRGRSYIPAHKPSSSSTPTKPLPRLPNRQPPTTTPVHDTPQRASILTRLRDRIRYSHFLDKRVILTIFNAGLVLHLTWVYVVSVNGCTGPSMLPTIAWDGDWVIISKLHRFGRGVTVGDLVSYHHPIRQGISGIKRIVGMPGDFVLRDTPKYTPENNVDGEQQQRIDWMIQVPLGHCWIVGDNFDGSRDSRMFGPLPLALIRGKVVARFWPRPAWYQNGLQDPEPVRQV